MALLLNLPKKYTFQPKLIASLVDYFTVKNQNTVISLKMKLLYDCEDQILIRPISSKTNVAHLQPTPAYVEA